MKLINLSILAGLAVSTLASAATVYECRAYTGASFYASNYCSQHNAVGVLNHTVPDGLPFDQQVQLVNTAKAKEAARRQADEVRWLPQSGTEAQAKAVQCQQLDQAITIKDAELRQPHSGQWGDYLAAERRKLMDRRFELRC